MTRWITGIILAPLVVCLLLFVDPVWIQWILVLLSILGLKEYFQLTDADGSFLKCLTGVLCGGVLTALLIFWVKTKDEALSLYTALLLFTFIIHFFGSPDFSERIKKMAFFFFGILYVSLLFSHWGWLFDLERWQFWVFLMVVSTVMSDTGGYIFGRLLGKHKLAPKLSPGKTIEGLVGGSILSVLASFVVRFFFWPQFDVILLVVIALVVSFIGPMGDLSESLLKRGTGVKDSGNLIPGHGGILDRVDALLFAAPVVYYFAKYFL